MSSSEEEILAAEIEIAAEEAVSGIIPEKSKSIYEKTYKKFCDWLEQNKIKKITETVMLAFFSEKSKSFKCSTMWSDYSKLKCTIYLYQNVDISKFVKLIAFLKRRSVGHVAKKSKVLRFPHFCTFISEADDKEFLMMKAVLIFGIAGACRREELTKLSTDNVSDTGSYILVDITDTKTHVPRQFAITEGSVNGCNLLGIVRKYISLRKPGTPNKRFFVGYRGGGCIIQPVGINSIGSIPKKIAEFLKLPDTQAFTGHCFRRSSATLLAEAGADLSVLMRHAGWKSSSVAGGYVEGSVANKCKIARQILGDITSNDNVITEVRTSSQEVTIVKKSVQDIHVVNIPQESVTTSDKLIVVPEPVTVQPELLDMAAKLCKGTVATPNSISGSVFTGCNFYFHQNK